jgi:hypothetical protein
MISMQYLMNILNDSRQILKVLIHRNKYVLKICDQANTTKGIKFPRILQASHSSVSGDSSLLECYTMFDGKELPTF